jgi:ribosomal protein L31
MSTITNMATGQIFETTSDKFNVDRICVTNSFEKGNTATTTCNLFTNECNNKFSHSSISVHLFRISVSSSSHTTYSSTLKMQTEGPSKMPVIFYQTTRFTTNKMQPNISNYQSKSRHKYGLFRAKKESGTVRKDSPYQGLHEYLFQEGKWNIENRE